MGRRHRKGRQVNGILILDKPEAMSSNAALQTAKRLYYANKAGHTGSLDPLATGVLPICFGEATKFSQFLLQADKAYEATVVLGAASNTEDADGQLTLEGDIQGITLDKISAAAQEGEQTQVPPMFSALKQDGQRLYRLARQGIEVEREARHIQVHRFEVSNLRDFATDRLAGAPLLAFDIDVHVSKGTYVRTLASDLGKKLGVGAYLQKLRRTSCGCFRENQLVAIDQLESLKENEDYEEMDSLLLPVNAALTHLPSVELDEQSSFFLRRGNPVQVPKAPLKGMVSVLDEAGSFVGVAEIDEEGRVAPRRLVVS